MNFTILDLKYLRGALIGLGFAILVGGGGVWVINYFRVSAEKENRTAIAKRTEAQNRLSRVSQEQQELTEKIALFQNIVARGYTAAEDRLDWIEQLDRLHTVRKITDFQYEFSAQQPLDTSLVPSGPIAAGYEFRSSKQRMTMKVLHEADVWNFINDISTQARALIVVRSCAIERLPLAAIDRGTGPYLAADCVLEWITLKERT